MNAGRPPCCSVSWRMSGVLGQKLGLKYSRLEWVDTSVKYSVSSGLVLRQVKYVYDCVKPSFASLCMTRGRVKASERKMSSGCFALRSRIAHSQNSNDLVCGLSTRNTFTPWPAQNSKIDLSSSHSDCHAGVSKSNG